MDMGGGGTQPVYSKNDTFFKLERPNTWGYMFMNIGLFELYIQFTLIYEFEIGPWRYILSKT